MSENENTEPTAGAGRPAGQPGAPEKSVLSHKPLWAQLVSDVFSPLVIPTFAMAVALWCTGMRTLPADNRLMATLAVALITGLLPFAVIAMLRRTGRVSDNAISTRGERLLPMAVAAVCYFGAWLQMRAFGAPDWLCRFFLGGMAAIVIAMAITRFWKISAHATAAGGFLGMTAWCVASGLADINAMSVLSVVTLVAGLVGTARLMLGRHDLWQVIAGLALGFGCVAGIKSI